MKIWKNQGRRIIEICQELNCDAATLAYVSSLVMKKRNLLADKKPSWGKIINWIERNKDVLKKEIEDLKIEQP